MSRPLIATKPMGDKNKAKRQRGAALWHRECFAAHGSSCFFCGGRATDAMHILGRGRIGTALAYAIDGAVNGRPGCRACHDLQGAGKLRFPIALVRAAVKAHNKLARVPLEML